MPQPEREPIATQREHVEKHEKARKARHRAMGERAAYAFTFLPEIETAHEDVRDYLQSRVIGQDDAIDAIIGALDRSKVRSHLDTRPMATFAFLGRTGTGKTETAKALSEILSPYGPNLLSIDCAMFNHGHEVATLTGSPPGYVGGEQKPLLRPDTVEQEGTVILFDEIEKGAQELHNLLLHITDKGELTLNNGSTVSFRNAVVIMTSNLGAREMAKEANGRAGFGVGDQTMVSDQAMESTALRAFADFFNPESVGHTRPIVFRPLNEDALHQVLDVKLTNLNRAYVDDFGATINLSPKTREHLVLQAMSRQASGARPLVDALDEGVASTFGRYVAHDRIEEGTEVLVYHRDELEGQVPSEYKSDLIFATRPNATIKKKVVPPSVPKPPIVVSSSTDVVKFDGPTDDEDDEKDGYDYED